MREKDIHNRIKMLHHRLDLINLYRNDFIEKLGVKGTEDLINQDLEELKVLLDLRTKMQSQKNKDNEK